MHGPLHYRSLSNSVKLHRKLLISCILTKRCHANCHFFKFKTLCLAWVRNEKSMVDFVATKILRSNLFSFTVFGRLFVKRFALAIGPLSGCLFVCMSVCLSCPVCYVGVLWPNGWTDQDETWHAGRTRPWPHCVRWGPSPAPRKGGGAPNFRPMSIMPDGWMDQDATWHGQATLC